MLRALFVLVSCSLAAENSGGQDFYSAQDEAYTSDITRLSDLTRQLRLEEDTGVRDSYEAFLSADPTSLRRALYHASNAFNSFDDPSDLALIATLRNRDYSDSTSDDDTLTCALQTCPEEDLDWMISVVPTDREFDAMPHMTLSGFLWSWVPGTSSWAEAKPPTSFTNYRPVRIELVIGTPIKHEQVRKTVKLVQGVCEAANTCLTAASGGSQEKHELLSGLLDLIDNLSGSLESCLAHILVMGDRVRRHDHLTHTIKNPTTLMALIDRLNSDISLGVGQQALAYEYIQMPLLELQSDYNRQKKIARHVYGIWEMLPALQTAFEFLLEHVTKQIRLMDVLLQHIADRLIDFVGSAMVIGQRQLEFLEAAIMALPTPETRQRIHDIVKTRLTENQLAILFDSLAAPYTALPVKMVILERVSQLVNVAISRLINMIERKGTLNRALTYIDFNLGEPSSDEY